MKSETTERWRNTIYGFVLGCLLASTLAVGIGMSTFLAGIAWGWPPMPIHSVPALIGTLAVLSVLGGIISALIMREV